MAQNIYNSHLFYTKPEEMVEQLSAPLGVLVGCVGTGKTTFFNLITNKNMDTSDGGESVTRYSFSSHSSYGSSFKIIDTPGTSADTDKVNHALHLRNALIEGPINRIFLVIKNERYGAMQKNLSEQIFALSEWKHLITVVVTHWDKEVNDANKKIFLDGKQKLLDQEIGLQNSFIYVGIKSDANQVCQAVYQNLSINKPVKLDISLKEFKYKFDLLENMNCHIREFKALMKKIEEQILKDIIHYKEPDKDEFLHYCIVDIAQIAEDIINEFQVKYGKDMIEIDSYMHYLELKAFFIPIVDNIRKVASQCMSYSLLNPKDPRNLFKKCPNCGIIWLKVEGCDGLTSCGKRFYEMDFYANVKQFMRFKFDWRNFQWVKKTESITQKEKQSYSSNTKGIGCGQTIDWRAAPPIGDEIIKTLYDAGIQDVKVDYKEEQHSDFNEELLKKSQTIKVYQC